MKRKEILEEDVTKRKRVLEKIDTRNSRIQPTIVKGPIRTAINFQRALSEQWRNNFVTKYVCAPGVYYATRKLL